MNHPTLTSAGGGGEAIDLVRQVGYRELTPLQRTALPHLLAATNVAVEAPRGTGRMVAFVLPAVVCPASDGTGPKGLFLGSAAQSVSRIAGAYRRFLKAGHGGPIVTLGDHRDAGDEAALLRRSPHVVAGTPARVIDHIRRGNVDLSRTEYVAVDSPVGDRQFRRDVEFILAKTPPGCRIAVFAPTLEEETLRALGRGRRYVTIRARQWGGGTEPAGAGEGRDAVRVSPKKIDEEGLKRKIDEILKRITLEEDPYHMNDLKRLYKRHVPLHRRAYFSAYLLDQIAPLEPAAREKTSGRDRDRQRRETVETATGSDTGDFVKLFVSIGKKRRIFPRDLQEHFATALSIDRQDLGQTKVLDNYSFIEIARRHADRAIAELTNTELRGRKITVNYAHTREDKSSS